jgi:hypothetical protein
MRLDYISHLKKNEDENEPLTPFFRRNNVLKEINCHVFYIRQVGTYINCEKVINILFRLVFSSHCSS